MLGTADLHFSSTSLLFVFMVFLTVSPELRILLLGTTGTNKQKTWLWAVASL